jgi:hypothetical protein
MVSQVSRASLEDGATKDLETVAVVANAATEMVATVETDHLETLTRQAIAFLLTAMVALARKGLSSALFITLTHQFGRSLAICQRQIGWKF